MRKHGERVNVGITYTLPANVCTNPDCSQVFILLKVRYNGDVCEQVGNVIGELYCPYCREKVGVK